MRRPPLGDNIDSMKTLVFGDFANRLRIGVHRKHECPSCLIDFIRAVLWCDNCHSISRPVKVLESFMGRFRISRSDIEIDPVKLRRTAMSL